MRIIALANQKGGCGKTTVATNLAAALAERGARVLLFDNDPQGHATLACGLGESDFGASAYDLYLTTDQRIEDVRREVAAGLDLVPAGVELSAVEPALAAEAGRDERLTRALGRSALPYDVVLIDCPPNVGLLTFNALIAARDVVVPVDPSRQTVQAVRKFRETLDVLRERRGIAARAWLLLSNHDPRPRYARVLAAALAQEHGEALLETVIHHSVRIKEAFAAGVPVGRFDPASRSALDFRKLADEVLDRAADQAWPASASIASAASPGPRVTAAGIRFHGEFPGARSVRVTGTFTGWSADGEPLQRVRDGAWEAVMPIPSGRHEYRYIVDGDWRADPENAEAVPNVFGGVNSLLLVP